MLISRRDGELRLVRQVEHARLCGDFVSRWGNADFARPEPLEGARIGAAMHDEGWREPDEEPLFNHEARRPLHFLEIEMEQHVPLYARGVERAFAADLYGGMLVSMHWTGLYRSRWGMQAGRVQFADEALQDEAVEHEERRWIDVKRELTRDRRRSDLETSLWHNYDLLQVWDLLSLYVCLIDLDPAPDAPPRPVPETLRSIDQHPGERTIEAVPVSIGGERVTLTFTAVQPGVVIVDPYPFDASEVTWEVAARAIEDRPYAGREDAAEALAGARETTIACTMTRA
jgi:hypothetical protein